MTLECWSTFHHAPSSVVYLQMPATHPSQVMMIVMITINMIVVVVIIIRIIIY